MLKKILKKILSNFGFKLVKTKFPEVRYGNFKNLTQAYEKNLMKFLVQNL